MIHGREEVHTVFESRKESKLVQETTSISTIVLDTKHEKAILINIIEINCSHLKI